VDSLHSFVDEMGIAASNVSRTALEHLDHLNISASNIRRTLSYDPSAFDLISPWLCKNCEDLKVVAELKEAF